MVTKHATHGTARRTLLTRQCLLPATLLLTLACMPLYAKETPTANASCTAAINTLNTTFSTVRDKNGGKFREDSGLLVHTIHGPPSADSTGGAFLDFAALAKVLKQEGKAAATNSCGHYISQNVFPPWCGSNKNPTAAQPGIKVTDDSSSWSFLRLDTLIDNRTLLSATDDDEVVCSAESNKRYGLIFSADYMNHGDNLGCMYPLDGDTGNRVGRGCGISVNPNITLKTPQGKSLAHGACLANTDDMKYRQDFHALLHENGGAYASYAGSLVCSLASAQFDIWVKARELISLADTQWPINEFVLFNWEKYSAKQLHDNNFLLGVYYLTGCARTDDSGNYQAARQIADLYKQWTGGLDIPVVGLSNATLRKNDKKARETPFFCPTVKG